MWIAAGLITTATAVAAALAAPDTSIASPQTPVRSTFVEAPVAVAGLSAAPEGYDGTYEFVRVQFGSGGGGFSRRGADWAHDYPRADREIISVLNEVTNMRPRPDAFRVLRMDDPDIFTFPVIYLVEIGSWRPSPTELGALRDYLRKGGFLIVDDFRGGQLPNLYWIMNQVAPEHEVLEVPDDHPVFDSFFRIEAPRDLPTHPVYGRMQPVYLGLFEDNDPNGRLLAIFNYDNDIAEWWETFSTGYYPIDLSNEAFKFGVNYIVYAHTH
jgi:hypothetical protein